MCKTCLCEGFCERTRNSQEDKQILVSSYQPLRCAKPSPTVTHAIGAKYTYHTQWCFYGSEEADPNVFVSIHDAGDDDAVDITVAKTAGASNIELLNYWWMHPPQSHPIPCHHSCPCSFYLSHFLTSKMFFCHSLYTFLYIY